MAHWSKRVHARRYQEMGHDWNRKEYDARERKLREDCERQSCRVPVIFFDNTTGAEVEWN